jgi:hypothetical protein
VNLSPSSKNVLLAASPPPRQNGLPGQIWAGEALDERHVTSAMSEELRRAANTITAIRLQQQKTGGGGCCSVELAVAVFRPRPKFHINAQGSLW